jgi:hypothetical protein
MLKPSSMSAEDYRINVAKQLDGNNIEALYRDVGNIGHNAAPTLG